MKIAKCKCGAEPIFLENGPRDCHHTYCCQQYKAWHAYCCQQCKAWMHWVNDKEEARRLWNSLNTDEHGQQLTEQAIQWTEWDGDVEHLPPEGTTILIKAKSFNNFLLGELRINVHNEPVLDIWTTVRQKIKKGDQFAVVEEDSHAS